MKTNRLQRFGNVPTDYAELFRLEKERCARMESRAEALQAQVKELREALEFAVCGEPCNHSRCIGGHAALAK